MECFLTLRLRSVETDSSVPKLVTEDTKGESSSSCVDWSERRNHTIRGGG